MLKLIYNNFVFKIYFKLFRKKKKNKIIIIMSCFDKYINKYFTLINQ